MSLAGVNPVAGSPVWGAYYPGVTSRKALKRPAWSSALAGPRHVETPPARRLVHDADLGVRNHPLTMADVAAWSAFTVESAAAAVRIVEAAPLSSSQRAAWRATVAALTLSRPL